jgi:hypothetical protein
MGKAHYAHFVGEFRPMNALVRKLRRNPELADEIAKAADGSPDQDFVPWEDVAAVMARSGAVRRFTQNIATNPDAQEAFATAGVPVIDIDEWKDALHDAQPIRSAERRRQWVVGIESPSTGLVIALPEDASTLRRVAFFADRASSGLVAMAFVRRERQPGKLLLSDGRHCSLPSRGRCDPGACGSCRVARRTATPPGLICVCPHER